MTRTPRTPAIRRRPKRDDVRRDLLTAAARVFARLGIDEASLDEVAADAGYTKGAIYSNFGSKAGLVAALVDDRTSAYLQAGLAAVEATQGPLPSQATALGDRLDQVSQGDPDWQVILVELWRRAVRGDPSVTAFGERRAELHHAIAAAAEALAGQAGVTLAFTPAEAATVIMAVTHGMAMERLMNADDVPDGLLGRVLALIAAPAPR